MQTAITPRGIFSATARVLSGLLLASAASTAHAQEAGSGAYVRAEIGAAIHQNVTFTDTNPTAANCDLCTSLFPSTIGTSFMAGGAIGYRVAPQLRLDLSADYLASATVTGHSVGAPASSTGSANVDSVVGLLNGYFDLPVSGLLGTFQPYIDAGIGIARNSLGVTTGNSAAVGPFTIAGARRTNFAWAAGIGGEFALTPRVSLDIGYRYLNLGQFRTDSSLSVTGATLQVTPSKTDNSSAHTLTIGLRYKFQGP